MIIAYPNQKIAKIHKAPTDSKHIYGVLNKEAAFAALQNLTHNETRAFMYLSLNQPNYTMALSTSDMARKVGSTEDGMRKAIQGLIQKGYLVQDQGRSYDFYDDPYDVASERPKSDHDESSAILLEKEGLTNGNYSGYQGENKGEIIHENTLKNTVNYKTHDLKYDLSSDWKSIFERIKVNCFPHTMDRLKKAAGCEPDWRVIKRIVSENWSAFEKGLGEQEGYRLNTLTNLVGDQYKKWEHVIAMEEAEYLRVMEEARHKPRINYDLIHHKEPEQEGLGDISALLDEMFSDVS